MQHTPKEETYKNPQLNDLAKILNNNIISPKSKNYLSYRRKPTNLSNVSSKTNSRNSSSERSPSLSRRNSRDNLLIPPIQRKKTSSRIHSIANSTTCSDDSDIEKN